MCALSNPLFHDSIEDNTRIWAGYSPPAPSSHSLSSRVLAAWPVAFISWLLYLTCWVWGLASRKHQQEVQEKEERESGV